MASTTKDEYQTGTYQPSGERSHAVKQAPVTPLLQADSIYQVIDSEGNTMLMQKGDEVYLGYLTDIDYDNQTVTFVLNKGGMIEYQTMKLGENYKRKVSQK